MSDFDLTREIALEQKVKRLELYINDLEYNLDAKDTQLKVAYEQIEYLESEVIFKDANYKTAIKALKQISKFESVYKGILTKESGLAIEVLKQLGVEE